MKYTKVFRRYEKKYRITHAQQAQLLGALGDKFKPDEFGKSTICNIYFDTPDFRLIRMSMEKPVYKEKLRIRSYNVPSDDSTVFIELKKKYDGVVYKRRINMPYKSAVEYLCRGVRPQTGNRQVQREIEYCFSVYPSLRPAISLFYDREAFFCTEDEQLRITFDSNVRFRTKNLDLAQGSGGYRVLPEGELIMEIKCAGAMPLWLSHELDKMSLYPTSYSKYANCFSLMFNARAPAKR